MDNIYLAVHFHILTSSQNVKLLLFIVHLKPSTSANRKNITLHHLPLKQTLRFQRFNHENHRYI